MQTFLPHPSYAWSAHDLDRQRLGKQRVEVLQILKALAGETTGWVNHPAVRMWCGHERSLVMYGVTVCNEWVNRGYKDTCRQKIRAYWNRFPVGSGRRPSWVGDDAFHRSHRSNLKRKDPDHYPYTDVPYDLPYVWPGGPK